MLCTHSMILATSRKIRGASHLSRLHVRIPASVQRPSCDWHTSPAPPSTCPGHVSESPRVLRAHSSLSLKLKELLPTRVRISWSQLGSGNRVTRSRDIRGWNTWLSVSTRQPESQHVAPEPLLNTWENWDSQRGRHAVLTCRLGAGTGKLVSESRLNLTSSCKMRTAASKESLLGENWGCLMIRVTEISVKFCFSGDLNPEASNSPSLTFNLLKKDRYEYVIPLLKYFSFHFHLAALILLSLCAAVNTFAENFLSLLLSSDVKIQNDCSSSKSVGAVSSLLNLL